MRRTLTALVAAIAFAAFASPAAAAEYAPQSAVISYADLDLATERGANSMLRRINRAARDVCGMDTGATLSLGERREARACVRETVEQTVASMAQPVVTALYVERTGRQPAMVLASN